MPAPDSANEGPQGSVPNISVLLLGDEGVGKSTFITRLSHPVPRSQSTPTPLPPTPDSEPATFHLQTRHGRFHLHLSSTHAPAISSTSPPPDVIILCYSIASRASLLHLQTKWKKVVETQYNWDEGTPVMVLGLKRDLRGERGEHGERREWEEQVAQAGGSAAAVVKQQEALRISQEMRADRYAECSALTGELCGVVWEDIVGMAVDVVRGKGRVEAEYCGIM